MNCTWVYIGALAVLLGISSTVRSSGPVPAFNWHALLDASDLVVSLEASEGAEGFLVTQSFFGDAAKGDILTLSEDAVERMGLVEGRHVTAFLKYEERERKALILAARHHSWFESAKLPDNFDQRGRETFEAHIVMGLSSDERRVVRDSVVWVRHLRSDHGYREIRRLAEEARPSPIIFAAYLILEIPTGARDIIDQANAFLATPEAGTIDAMLMGELQWAFAGIREPENVAQLNQLLTEADPVIAKAIVFSAADWGWADDSSVKVLIKSLGRLDREGQYKATIILAELADRPKKTYAEFASDPDAVVQAWKEWWAETGQAKYGATE